MTSMHCKRMVAVATLATSVVLMGGAAFASPANGIAATGTTTGLAPAAVGAAVEAARNTAADGQNQIKKAFARSDGKTTVLAPAPVGAAVEAARNTAADGQNQLKRAF